MTIKCAIIDDEPLAIELLVSYVKKIPFMELCGKYSNAVDAMKGIDPHDMTSWDSSTIHLLDSLTGNVSGKK